MSGPVLVVLTAVLWWVQRRRIRRHQPPREAWWLNLAAEAGFVWYAVAHRDVWLLAVAAEYGLSYLDYLRLWRAPAAPRSTMEDR